MEPADRVFLIEMIMFTAMVMIALWWFGDCLRCAERVSLYECFGSKVEAKSTQPFVISPPPSAFDAGQEMLGGIRPVRGFREM